MSGKTIDQTQLDKIIESQPLDFAGALSLLLMGKKVKRTHWKELRYIYLQTPDDLSKMKKAYIVGVGLDHNPFPYNPLTNDILSKDWYIQE